MRLSIKEKAGIADISRIYERLHLSREFIRNMALHPENLEPEFKDEGEIHFGMCDKCRKKKEGYLFLESEN